MKHAVVVELYHHPERRDEAMNVDFGVQVAQAFAPQGNVRCVETPASEVARLETTIRYLPRR